MTVMASTRMTLDAWFLVECFLTIVQEMHNQRKVCSKEMCERLDRGERHPNNRIDSCIRHLMTHLNRLPNFPTVSSCCGHGVYPLTIVIKNEVTGEFWELLSGRRIPRKQRFYVRDRQGRYYIPEVCDPIQNQSE